jgi:integrase
MAYSTRSPAHKRHTPSFAQPLPRYLLRRGTTFYFKRKVPRGLEHAFSEAKAGQVWKSLGTDLLEKARVLLAAEVGEFELRVAKARRDLAHAELTHVHEPAPTACEPSRDAPAEAPMPPRPRLRANPAPAAAPATVAQTRAALPVAAAALTLRHLLEAWKQTQSRARTKQTFETAVNEFHTVHGPLPAQEITRDHARRYRDTLVERRLSDGTVANRLGFLATLFRFGQIEMIEHVLGNPFERIPVNSGQRLRVQKERRAYSVEELNTIFASKLYTGGYRPRGQVAEAGYWAPLLGPFVGARIEEIAQLRVQDIESVNGVWCIRICDVAADQHLKTPGSYRRVPVHHMLQRCGFLQFAQAQRDAGHDRLFPSLSNDNANRTWSNALGKWYARYLDGIGLSDPALDYHSFRYSFKQQCSLCGIGHETRDALTGHWVGRRDGGRTYMKAEERQYPFPALVEAVRLLRYDELRLGHLFVN